MTYPRELIERIAAKHGLKGEPELLPAGGMVNEAWRIGEHVLRICKEKEGRDEAAREAAVVPLLVDAGLLAPKLVTHDLQPDLTDLPYTIYERARGVLLGYCEFEPSRLKNAYRQVGAQIALLGRMEVTEELRPVLRDGRALQPWKTLAKAMAHKVLPTDHGLEVSAWLELLDKKLGEPLASTLIHMDIHPWNVFVDPDRDELTAIIDWGDASLGDPALEFASMPIETVPYMLEGYVAAGGPMNEGFTARSVHAGLSLGLWEIRELPEENFARQWWRMPPQGWPGVKSIVAATWPDLAGEWS